MKTQLLQAGRRVLNTRAGNCLKTDGVNDYVNFSNNNFYNIEQNDFTLVARVFTIQKASSSFGLRNFCIYKNQDSLNGFWLASSHENNVGYVAFRMGETSFNFYPLTRG